MYAREVDGKAITLGVSGMLWNRSLVMYDKETNTLWSHLLGQAKQGKLRGKTLEQVPSVMTDWKTWSKDHPTGTVAVLSRTSREYRREFYRRPGDFVLGIAGAGQAKAWPFDELSKKPVVNDSWDKSPVVVLFDKESMTARLFARKVKGRELTFEVSAGQIKDRQTDSTWEPTTGRAVAGPLKGSHLEALPAIVSYRRTWLAFHPESKE